MKLKIIYFLLILVTVATVSCKTGFEPQVYWFQPSIIFDIYNENEIIEQIVKNDIKSIAIKNDSIMEYRKRYGGVCGIVEIKYILVSSELVADSLSLQGCDIPNVTNVRFLFSRDSLMNKKTNEKYYNQKYLDRIMKRMAK